MRTNSLAGGPSQPCVRCELQMVYSRGVSPVVSPCHMPTCRMPEEQAWGIMLLLQLLQQHGHKWACKGV